MTFCAGLKVRDGLIGITDTRVTTRTEHIVARKLVSYNNYDYEIFVTTPGLRSMRDRTLNFNEFLQ